MAEYGLRGRVALISGINNPKGIGAATALAFAREGAKLVLVYKKVPHGYEESKTQQDGLDYYYKANGGDASAVEEKLRAVGAQYLLLERDISQAGEVREIFERAVERFGGVNILVNNAAAADEDGTDTIETLSQQTMENTFQVNVFGTLLMIREFVSRRGDGGRIINLSTDAAQVFAGQITYGASKAAIEAFTRSIAMEVGKYGITVNCVAPGPTQTGYIDEALERLVVPQIPLGSLIQPEEIADTILFLASERASQVTGQVVKVSGGHAL